MHGRKRPGGTWGALPGCASASGSPCACRPWTRLSSALRPAATDRAEQDRAPLRPEPQEPTCSPATPARSQTTAETLPWSPPPDGGVKAPPPQRHSSLVTRESAGPPPPPPPAAPAGRRAQEKSPKARGQSSRGGDRLPSLPAVQRRVGSSLPAPTGTAGRPRRNAATFIINFT